MEENAASAEPGGAGQRQEHRAAETPQTGAAGGASRAIDLLVYSLVSVSVLMVFVALFVPGMFAEFSAAYPFPRVLLISLPLAIAAGLAVAGGYLRKIPMRIMTVRHGVQGLCLYAINATAVGSFYVAPFLPTLRFRYVGSTYAGLPICIVGSTARCFSETWAPVSGPALVAVLYFTALLAVLIVVGVLIGSAMCAWVCPIGLMHDIITRARARLGIRSREFSQRTNDILSMSRFAILIFFLLIALSIGAGLLVQQEAGELFKSQFGELPLVASGSVVCQFCPAPITGYFVPGAITSAVAGDFAWTTDSAARVAMFAFIWIGAIFISRFFCRYVCWTGAMISPLNKVSALTLQKDNAKCTGCNYCAGAGPMQVGELRDKKGDCRLDNVNCNFCLECVDVCPEKALCAKFGGKTLYTGRGAKGRGE